jgi:hypothetical protein
MGGIYLLEFQFKSGKGLKVYCEPFMNEVFLFAGKQYEAGGNILLSIFP